MDVNVKEVEATILNLKPGSILAIKMKGEEFLDSHVIASLRDQFKLLFPNNKVIILSMNDGHEINFEVMEQEKKEPCSVVNYCEGCNCGKKELAEAMDMATVETLVKSDAEEIERLAKQSVENFGIPENMFDPATQQWIMKDGQLTEYGLEILQKKVRGE